ncbi:MAG TPA: NAD(+) kinase [Armatimonadetes bacterium]|nr:NAD(+) kinase [Armatimonadota bacterium]
MQTIGVMAATHRVPALEAARRLVQWLQSQRRQVLLEAETAEALGVPELAVAEVYAQADLLIVLGGDGSLVAAARATAPFGTPVVGVNFGRVGFLSQISAEEMEVHLAAVLEGKGQIEERMLLQAELRRGGESRGEFLAANDVVIGRDGFSRLLRLTVWAGGAFLATYSADGLIIATPTGSTAYSLSAGGPIVAPAVESILLTPICPHTLSTRPLVLSPREVLRIRVEPHGKPPPGARLTVDGQVECDLQPEDELSVRRAECRARLVTFGGEAFYKSLRRKLKWGAD